MSRARSRRLVVDANVAGAAGVSGARTSTFSRLFLESIRDSTIHLVILTPAISDEWKRHMSLWTRGWLTEMTSKKRIDRIVVLEHAEFRACIRRAGFGERRTRETEKDAHLVEAALVSDQVVCSLEVQAPKNFRRVGKIFGQIRNVTWADVNLDPAITAEWLRRGAHARRDWQLRAAE